MYTAKRAPTSTKTTIRIIPIGDITPSSENDQLYRPIDPLDPEIVALAESIAKHDLQEPLTLTSDLFIISGHRRFTAAAMAGLLELPCMVRDDVSHHADPDRFIILLREANRQRVKSFDEVVREEAISADPQESHRALIEYRKSRLCNFSKSAMDLGEYKGRKRISDAKSQMMTAINRIVDEMKQYWPLSCRGIHYNLCDDPPLRHTSKLGSFYTNDMASYHMLCDLLTRARIAGLISWQAIADETRVSEGWGFDRQVATFIAREMDRFAKNYWRDLQQSQPDHIELFIEKLTLENIVRPIAAEFCIPLTIGKGMCSSPPRWKLSERFKASGKDRLVVLLASDLDPDGITIGENFARSMRDDFHIENITAIRMALKPEQVKQYKLTTSLEAKESSRSYNKFVRRYGTAAYELEALKPAILEKIIRENISAVLDRKAFNHEVEQEKHEAAKLDAFRAAAHRVMSQIKGVK